MELGRKLVEKTDFLTKSCYPNLKPLFEVYCIHCVKTDKSLDDKDVVDVADEIVSCLASYGVEDMLELEKLVIEKDGNEKTTDAAMSDLLSNYKRIKYTCTSISKTIVKKS